MVVECALCRALVRRDADQVSEALQLAREVVAGLESGDLEPTAAALEPLADQPR